MCGYLSCTPHWGPGLTGNRTSNPLVHRLALNPLSHTSQSNKGCLNANLLNLFECENLQMTKQPNMLSLIPVELFV